MGSPTITKPIAPGGSDTEVQFNDGGSFGGDPNFLFEKVSNALSLTGSALLTAGAADVVPLTTKAANAQTAALHEYQDSAGAVLLSILADGDLKTDRWLDSDTNTFLGVGVVGAGNLAHAAGDEGWYNNAIGNEALYNLTTGYGNQAMGYYALRFNTTGGSNNAMGYRALYANTTGGSNNAMGYLALYSNTTGSYNNALGSSALRSNTTGSYNNAMGYLALYSNTTGSYNNAMGYLALYANTEGGSNNALGRAALRFNTTGGYNNALGYRALYANTTGGSNNALGYYALRYNTTGSYNNALGREAGHGVENSSDISNNQLIGYRAGYALLTGGDNNILIGHQAGDALTTGSDNIIIGYDIDAPAVDTSNHLKIGTALDGDLAGAGAVGAALRVTSPAAATIGQIIKLAAAQSANALEVQASDASVLASIGPDGTLTLADAANIVLDTTTGTELGTAAAQKLGFWGATPVVQQAHIADPAGGATQDAEARTAINAINAVLAAIGITAAA